MKRREGGYEIGVVSPLTLAGKEIRQLLRERGILCRRVALIDPTGGDHGVLTESDDEAVLVVAASEDAFDSLDVVFFCGDAESSEKWIDRRTEDGFLAIDVTRRPSIGEGVTVIAGINQSELTEETSLIVSPHPIAVTLGLLIERIMKRHPVRLCAATIVQPASELDKPGIDELFAQTISVLNIESPPTEVFGRQLAFNLFPAEGASSVERLIASQLRAVLGRDLPVSVSITQGTLFHGHTFSIFFQVDGDVAENDISELLGKGGGIMVAEDDETMTTMDAAGKDEIVVSRVSRDPAIPGGFWLWAAADNLRRGVALNAVLTVEYMIANFGEPVN